MNAEKIIPPIETHPLEPFLPGNAVLLMLGSFPPQKKRWSMDFFYPNLQNDMWRIIGIIFFSDKDHFLHPDKKSFDKERIIEFLNEKGIALYDTASAVRRLQDNASDKFLAYIIHSGFISGYQNRYGDNLKPPTNVYHRMTA